MKKAIIYGGAFNPPTTAHVQIVQALIRQAKQDGAELWILPSGERHDKTIGAATHVRLAYIDALLESVKSEGVPTRVVTVEIESSVPTQTCHTVSRLKTLYPNYRLRWVFGADSVLTMKTWHKGEQLFNELPMYVVARPGYELTAHPPKAIVIPTSTVHTSSSLVRDRLAAGLPIGHLVPPAVLRCLKLSART